MDKSQFAGFVASTREYIFIRPEDNLLILRPNKVHHLNATATAMLRDLYAADPLDVDALLAGFAARYGAPPAQIQRDLGELLEGVQWRLRDGPGRGPAVRRTRFGSHTIKLPVL